MRAVHTIWTKPSTYKVKKKWFQESTDSIYTTRSVDKKYFMKDFELLTLVASALFYKKFSGKIDLYTDNTGYEYFKEQKILVITKDINLRVKCDALGIAAEDYYKDSLDLQEFFKGVCETNVTDLEIDQIYSTGSIETDLDLPENTYSIVKDKIQANKTYCSLCSRLRRAHLYRIAREEKCTAVILGHHQDDILETFFLNLFHGGKLSSMPPKLINDEGTNIYDLFKYKNVIITSSSVKKIEGRILNEKS